MIQRGKAFLAVAMLLMLAVCMSGPAQAEEGADVVPAPGEPAQTQEPTPPQEPADEPVAPVETPQHTQAPATQEPIVPLPGTPQHTEAPATEEPTEVPTQEPATQQPAQSGGSVNVTIYVQTSAGVAAAGYRVTIDQTSLAADAQGMVRFPNVNVGQHQVTITSPNGQTSVGHLYMSRGGTTVLTDKAMGGTYGMNIAEGQNDIYLVITFVPEEAMDIEMLSNTPPAIPQTQPSTDTVTDIEHPSKTIVASFLGEDDNGLANLTLTATSAGVVVGNTVTDSRGQATLRDVPYGTYSIAASGAGLDTSFELTMLPAATTGIRQNSGPNFVVAAASNAATLYLQFQQVGDMLVLTEARDSALGISPMVLGIIIVGGIVVVVIVLVVVLRRRSRKKKAMGRQGAPARQAAGPEREPARDAYYGTVLPDQDPYENEYGPDENGQPVRRTGGPNKYHDRQRM